MQKIFTNLSRWIPALAIMTAIFLFSSQPSKDLPHFGSTDYFIKKTGHAVGYALLALAYQYALGKQSPPWRAWLFAVLFSATDEYHQSFVPGRHPSIWDVVIFDNCGALFALILWKRKGQPSSSHD